MSIDNSIKTTLKQKTKGILDDGMTMMIRNDLLFMQNYVKCGESFQEKNSSARVRAITELTLK